MRKSAQVAKVFAVALILAAVPGQAQKEVEVSGTLTEYATPTKNSCPSDVAMDLEGHIWFTETNASKIGKLDVAKNTIEEYPVRGVFPVGIVWDGDGNIFVSGENNSIGELDPVGEKYTEWIFARISSGTNYSGLSRLGGNVYFADSISNAIVELNPSTDRFTYFRLPTTGSEPVWLNTLGKDLVFTEEAAGKIGLLDPPTSTVKEFTLPEPAHPFGISVGGGGDSVWASDSKTNKLYNINLLANDGIIDEPPPPTSAGVWSLYFYSSGKTLSFTDPGNNSVGVLTPSDQTPAKTFKIKPVITTVSVSVTEVKPTITLVTPNTYSVEPTVTPVTGVVTGGFRMFGLPTPTRLPTGIVVDEATGTPRVFGECGDPGHVAWLKFLK